MSTRNEPVCIPPLQEKFTQLLYGILTFPTFSPVSESDKNYRHPPPFELAIILVPFSMRGIMIALLSSPIPIVNSPFAANDFTPSYSIISMIAPPGSDAKACVLVTRHLAREGCLTSEDTG